ncbi:hypothetical protein SDC9_209154 [bioreactor metagenome]|uniref:Uncharacterized protein n=1 Tax=bioreactor metagenome TaxID=1076179 RepID=A0A645JDK7_9ZZZZ
MQVFSLAFQGQGQPHIPGKRQRDGFFLHHRFPGGFCRFRSFHRRGRQILQELFLLLLLLENVLTDLFHLGQDGLAEDDHQSDGKQKEHRKLLEKAFAALLLLVLTAENTGLG